MPPDDVRDAAYVATVSRTMTIAPGRPRGISKIVLFLALLLPIVWSFWREGVRWWDDYTAHSGVVIDKSEENGLVEMFLMDDQAAHSN
jgi:hypothetical protein